MIPIYCHDHVYTILKSDDINMAKEVAETISKRTPCYFECRDNIYYCNNGKLVGKIKSDKIKKDTVVEYIDMRW